jgi:ubiquinone biosynthesis protein
MNMLDFIDLIRMIYGKKKLDIQKIQEMGLLAVKIGQVHALRVDFLDPKKCQELSKLYRYNNTIPSEQVLSQVDESKFESIDKKPLASASVGQVHRAVLKTGEEVVIKIIKKDFKKKFEKEVNTVKNLFKFVIFFYPKLRKVFDPVGIIEHIEEYTLRELDLCKEIEGHETLRKIYDENKKKFDLSILKFVKIHKDLSSHNVMVSEFIQGKTFDALLDDGELSYDKMLDLFNVHGFYMFNIGTFHGDIHPGNIILNPKDNKIYFIDTGAIGHVSERLSKGLFNFFEALAYYDYKKCAVRMNEMASVSIKGEKFKRYEKKFLKLYSDFKGKTVTQISLRIASHHHPV